MSKSPTEKIFNKLFKRIFENFVFYIPSHLLELIDANEEQSRILNPYLNKVYLFDKAKGPIPFNTEEKISISSQATILNKNKYELIDYKKETDHLGFEFLFEDYYTLAHLFRSYSKWMFDELEYSSKIPQNKSFKNKLQLQYSFLDQHCNNLEKISSYKDDILSKETTNKTILDALNSNLSNSKINERFNDSNSLFSSFTKAIDPNNKPNRKKKVRANLQEIEEFLLKSHFNVKL